MNLAYNAFAKVYDTMQYDIDYDFWIDKIQEKIAIYKKDTRSILELACGTGTIGIGLSKFGFYVEGVDISDEMLTHAQEKAYNSKQRMKFYCQNMVELNTRRKYDCIVSMCDGMNYIVHEDDLKQVFERVINHLEPGGIFIFDLSTPYKLEEIIGNSTFAETFEESAYIWENEFDSNQKILNFWLTLFVEEGSGYERFEEHHKQRAYDLSEIQSILPFELECLECLDGDSFEEIHGESERMCIIARLRD